MRSNCIMNYMINPSERMGQLLQHLFYQRSAFCYQAIGQRHQGFLFLWPHIHSDRLFAITGENDMGDLFGADPLQQCCGCVKGVFKNKLEQPFTIHCAGIAAHGLGFDTLKENIGRAVVIKTFFLSVEGK